MPSRITALLPCIILMLSCNAVAQSSLRLPQVLGDHMVLQRDKPINIWGSAGAGQEVTVAFAGSTATATAGSDGSWSLRLPATRASARSRKLTVTAGKEKLTLNDVLVGEVWLCSGQSNMAWRMRQTQHRGEEIPKADHPRIRLLASGGGNGWARCTPETVTNFSGVGYHFGEALNRKLEVPIGLISASVGGTQIEPWTPRVGAARFPSLKKQAARGDGGLFKKFIQPVAPMTMRGIIWYQGESNVLSGDTTIYTDRQAALVAGWRTVFAQEDLSFYYVQIAPCTYVQNYGKRSKGLTPESLPRFWDAQTACLEAIPNSGMVVVTDITANVRDIHPGNKLDVGRRLARWALAKNYGKTKVVFSGPLYQSMETQGRSIRLSFKHIGGELKSLDGKALREFTIAGEDRKFVAAQARIRGQGIIVSAEGVDRPVAVRFGWREAATPNFGNAAGLPAVPFRTDDW